MGSTRVGGGWSVNNSNTGASAPSASQAAGAAGVSNVCTRVFLSFATATAVSAAILVNLRDGATGAGTVLNSWCLAIGENNNGSALAGVLAINYDSSGRNDKNTEGAYDDRADGQPGIRSSALNYVGSSATAMTLEFASNMPAASVGAVTMKGFQVLVT